MKTLYVMVVVVGVARSMSWADRLAVWHECPDGKQECADDSTCCSAGSGGGYLCCQNISMSGGPCCGDGCCTEGETCCSDDQGYACCLAQTTYCIAKTPGSTRPARCCPRWTVGCEVGSVGCCDPAQPWQWTIAAASHNEIKTPKEKTQRSISWPNPRKTSPSEAYALVVSGWDSTKSSLIAITIDIATGNVKSKVQVNGFSDNPAGESTREFLWDHTSKKFYYFDVNFTAFGGARPTNGRQPYLVTVDPISGTTTRASITGAKDFPTGYARVSDSGKVIMATEAWEKSAQTGYAFYSLDLTTAVATPAGTIAVDASTKEQDPAYYAGYHRVASPDGSEVYRVGYQVVTQQTGPGVGIITLSGTTATTKWVSETTQGHDYFMTANMDTHNATDSKWSLLSLAPSLTDPKRGLDLVRWSPSDTSVYTTVATLGNAHPPRVMGMGFLGYVASVVSTDGTFASLVVDQAAIPEADRWALATVDLTTGAAKVMPLEPFDLAGTWSISGLGI